MASLCNRGEHVNAGVRLSAAFVLSVEAVRDVECRVDASTAACGPTCTGRLLTHGFVRAHVEHASLVLCSRGAAPSRGWGVSASHRLFGVSAVNGCRVTPCLFALSTQVVVDRRTGLAAHAALLPEGRPPAQLEQMFHAVRSGIGPLASPGLIDAYA